MSHDSDWPEAVLAAQGDLQLVRIMAEAAIQQTPQLMAQLSQAIVEEDARGVQAASHTLKGSMRYFGKGTAMGQIRSLESMAKAGDLSGAAAALAILEPEIARTLRGLQHYVDRQ